MSKKGTGYKHLGIEERKGIERCLDDGRTLTFIAEAVGISVSTVSREILRNRRYDGRSELKGADRNDCRHLRSCLLKCICGGSARRSGCEKRLCRRCTVVGCHNRCIEYEPRTCERTQKAPFCCNGCERFNKCTLIRWRYFAETAQHQAQQRSHDTRSGIDMTKAEMDFLIGRIRAGLLTRPVRPPRLCH